MKKRTRSETYLRYLVQGFFLVFTTYLIIMHGKKGIAGGYPPIDTLCPFGGLETLYKFLSDGSFLQRVGMPAIVLLIGTVVGALVVGRAFCGSICPLGTLQEWFYNAFGKIIPSSLRKKMQVPANVDKVLRYAKYIVLILIIAFTWITHELVFRPFDPWATYAHVFGDWGELFGEFLLGVIILGLMFISTLLVSRAWCKYLCPFGGFLGILSKISWLKINRDNKTCINCNACNKSCPMGVDVVSSSTVNSAECIECGSCVAVCPVPDTLTRKAKIPLLKAPAVLIPMLAVLFFGGTYGIAKITDNWKSVGEITTYKGIRGSNSFKQVALSAGVSVKQLLETAGLSTEIENEPELMIKDLGSAEYKKKYNISDDFEVDVVREAFAKIKGEQFVPEVGHSSNEKTKVKESSENQSPDISNIEPGKKLVWGTDVKGSTPLKDFLKLSGKSRSDFIAKFSLSEDVTGESTLKDIHDNHGTDMEGMKAFFGVE